MYIFSFFKKVFDKTKEMPPILLIRGKPNSKLTGLLLGG